MNAPKNQTPPPQYAPENMYPIVQDEQLLVTHDNSTINHQPRTTILEQPTHFSSTQNLIQNPHQFSDWKRPLFGCFDNFALCLTTKFLPCVTFGEVSHKSGYGDCCGHSILFTLCPGFMICFQRRHVRERQGIKGGLCGDCLVAHCCGPCALIQHSHEVGAHYERPVFDLNGIARL